MVTEAVEQSKDGRKFVVRGTYKPYVIEKRQWNLTDSLVNNWSDKFTLYYTNCDVLTKTKMNELEVYIDVYSPDIICLTEVLPKNTTFDYSESMYYLKGYDLVVSTLIGRGIFIFCKANLQVLHWIHLYFLRNMFFVKLFIRMMFYF